MHNARNAKLFIFMGATCLSFAACGAPGRGDTVGGTTTGALDGGTTGGGLDAGTTGGSTTGTTILSTTGGTTGSGSAAFALTVNGTGYTPHAGETLSAALLDSTGATLGTQTATVAADGSFSVKFPGMLKSDQAYKVAYFSDHNKNGFCNVPPLDHSWIVPVPTVAGDTVLPVMHNAMDVPVCDSFGMFDIKFDGSAFAPHEGKTMYISLVDAKDKTEVGAVQHAVITGGAVSFTWPKIGLVGHAYTLAYFADLNGNKACDPKATDHQWAKAIPVVAANVAATGTHADPQSDICTPNFPAGPLP